MQPDTGMTTAPRALTAAGPAGGTASVLVADLHPVFIEGIEARIARETDISTATAVTDVGVLAEAIAKRRPAVTLVGFDLWQTSEAKASLALVQAVAATTRVILMYDRIDPHQAWRALHAGVVGLISRCAPAEQFVFAIRQVLSDGTFLDATIQEELASLARRDQGSAAVLLTRREQAVLTSSADGQTTQQIGVQLGLSSSSIKAALHGSYEKLGVHDRPAAVAQALRLGLIR
jgi:two-component system nitrate/nitrite response regulator NarL